MTGHLKRGLIKFSEDSGTMMINFSVIICVYNTPSVYLKKSIGSVLKQTYPNVEIIVVNDGSTEESTLLALAEFESISNVKIIHKSNGGQASARNCGMDHASGNYYFFLDSDDYYLSTRIFSDVARLLEESRADILSFQYAEFFYDNQRPVFRDGDLPREDVWGKTTTESAKALLKKAPSVFSAVTHTKAIKAELITRHNIRLPIGLKNEDVYFTAKLIQYAETYDRYDKVAYAYRRSYMNSLTANKNNFRDIEKSIVEMFKLLFAERDIQNNTLVLDFLASPYAYWMGKTVNALAFCENHEERGKIKIDISDMEKYSFVLKYSSRKYVKAIGVINSIFGMKFALFLLRVYLTFNRRHMLSLNRKIK